MIIYQQVKFEFYLPDFLRAGRGLDSVMLKLETDITGTQYSTVQYTVIHSSWRIANACG